jgi:hypothetical protein
MEWLEQLLKRDGSVESGDCLYLYYSAKYSEYRLIDTYSAEVLYMGHDLERALELMLKYSTKDDSNDSDI